MQNNKCLVCYESITDPICINCYLKQLKYWFKDQEINPLIKSFVIKKIKERVDILSSSRDNCILCNNEDVDICYYCFGYITSEILFELNLPDEITESFAESFNFDLMKHDFVMPNESNH